MIAPRKPNSVNGRLPAVGTSETRRSAVGLGYLEPNLGAMINYLLS